MWQDCCKMASKHVHYFLNCMTHTKWREGKKSWTNETEKEVQSMFIVLPVIQFGCSAFCLTRSSVLASSNIYSNHLLFTCCIWKMPFSYGYVKGLHFIHKPVTLLCGLAAIVGKFVAVLLILLFIKLFHVINGVWVLSTHSKLTHYGNRNGTTDSLCRFRE